MPECRRGLSFCRFLRLGGQPKESDRQASSGSDIGFASGVAASIHYNYCMKEPPNPGWLEFGKLWFGFLLLVLLAGLCTIIALGKVEQQTSHGLDTILGCLLTLSGGFAQWCFGGKEEK